MNALQTLADDLEIKSIIQGSELHCYAKAVDVFKLFKRVHQNTTKFMPIHEEELLKIQLSDANLDFHGGSKEEFLEMGKGVLDLSLFLKEKNKYKNIALKLQEESAKVNPMRKRRFSEHDGEWSLERQWEVNPFMATYKTNSGIKPTLQVNVDFGFNSTVSSEQISSYGAFTWAIVDAVEASGITCEINMEVSYSTIGSLKRGEASEIQKAHTHVNIKKAGEYIDQGNLARCFTPQFYRRGTFTLRQESFEVFGTKLNSEFGISRPQNKKISEPGTLNLNIDDSKRPDQEKIVKAVLEAITRKDS